VIDAAAGPDAGTTVARPVMNCGGDVGIIEITLPCQVGIAPLFAGECQLNAPARGKWAFITSLETMAENLNQRVDVGTVARGIVDVVPTFTSAGSSYRLTAVQGDAAIFQVDVTQRSFLGRLGHVDFVWTSDAGQEISCPLESGLFWAVPGEFL
jgi:hypothetical protein